MQDAIASTHILPTILSDHSPTVMTIKFLNSPQKGPDHWKFNVSILKEEEYKKQMKERFSELKM